MALKDVSNKMFSSDDLPKVIEELKADPAWECWINYPEGPHYVFANTVTKQVKNIGRPDLVEVTKHVIFNADAKYQAKVDRGAEELARRASQMRKDQ